MLAFDDLLEACTVSSIFTYSPLRPVNCSATWNGCERNFWILRARDTVSLSSSRKFVDTENRDDVLQVLVALQNRFTACATL